MASRIKVPKVTSSNLTVRVTANTQDIERANALVVRNYVAAGFWGEDEDKLRTNKILYAPARKVFVALEDGRLVGTMSIILDSQTGLPSDSVQPAQMQQLRGMGGSLAEVSAFAMERSVTSHRKLIFFLISYMFQYSFYHAGVDRLAVSCVPAHAHFYESALCFSKISGPTYYAYTRAVAYLLSLDLLQAHSLLSQKYPSDPATGDSFYRFLLGDPQPCQCFTGLPLKRPRNLDWIGRSLGKVA